MALSQRLDIKLSQALVMTPQLQQAIKLLQLNNIELGAFVDEELLQNPLLVRAEERDEPLTALATGDAGDDPRGQDPAFEPGARTELTELVGSGVMPDSEHAPLDTDIAGMFESDGPAPSQETPAQREMDLDPGLGFDAGGPVGRGGDMNFDGDDEGFEARTSRRVAARTRRAEWARVHKVGIVVCAPKAWVDGHGAEVCVYIYTCVLQCAYMHRTICMHVTCALCGLF